MKKLHLSRFVAVTFFMLFFVAVLTVSADAKEIKAENYDSLGAAVNAASDGDTVVISQDYILTEPVGIDRSVEIAGSGTVTASGVVFDMRTAGVELTLKGNVTYRGKEGILLNANGITVDLYDAVAFETTGSFMKDATTVTASTTTVNVFGGTYTAGGHCFEFSHGTGAVRMEIADGTFTAENHAISITKAGNVNILISNGTFTGKNHAIHIDGDAHSNDFTKDSAIAGSVHLTILDGEFTGKSVHAVNLKYAREAVILSVQGGTFKGGNMGIVLNALADGSTVVVSGNSSFTASGNHIFHIANTKSGDTVSVTVAGGTFTAKNHMINIEPNAGSTVLTVTGGTVMAGHSFLRAAKAAFKVKVSDTATITAATAFYVTGGYAAEIDMAGGTVSAVAMFCTDTELVPEISDVATVNADYMIHGATYVNVDGKTVYASLQTALNNVIENGTVTVIGNVTGASFEIVKGLTVNGTGTVKTTSTTFNVRNTAAGDTVIFEGLVKYESTGGICFSVQGGNITLKFGSGTEWAAKGNFLQDSGNDSMSGETATVIFVDGASVTATAGHVFYFGLGRGKASLTVTSGSVTSYGKNILMAEKACGDVSLTVSGGTLTTTAANTQIGSFTAADCNVSITVASGMLIAAKQSFYFGHGGSTVLTLSGGTFEAGGHNFDFNGGSGDLELNVSGNVDFAESGASTFCFNDFDGEITATVSGGIWSPKVDCFFFLNACAGDAVMNISSGTFEPGQRIFNLNGNTGAVSISVSGGMFYPVGESFHFGACRNISLTVEAGDFHVPEGKTFVNVSGSAVGITMTGGTVQSCLNGFTAYNGAAVTLRASDHTSINASRFIASVTNGATINMTLTGGNYRAPVFLHTDATVTPVLSDAAVIDVEHMIRGATFSDGDGNTVYADLAAAVSAVAKGGTVTVQGDPTLNASVFVTHQCTVVGTGTVTLIPNAAIFVINAENVELTLGGSVKYAASQGTGISLNSLGATVVFEDAVEFDVYRNVVRDNAGAEDGTVTVLFKSGAITSRGGNCFYFGDAASTVNVTVKSGSLNADANACLYFAGSVKKTSVIIEGGTFTSKNSNILFTNCDGREGLSVAVHNGTFFTIDGDAISITAKACDMPAVCNIYGGTFQTKNSRYVIHVCGDGNGVAAKEAPRVNVYGGYFANNQNACIFANKGGIANLYGGYFSFLGGNNVFGGVVFSGSGSDKGTVNVYGGNYVSKGSGVVFRTNNNISVIHLVGSYNALGGGALISNQNTSAGTPSTGYPVGKELHSASVYMTDGAGIRLVEGSNGLRFVGVITAEALAYINTIAEVGSVSFGTLICPADLVAKADSFTVDGLTRAGVKFTDLPAKNGLVARPEGGYYIRAAIVNIREENIGRKFAAVSYVKYVVNGEEVVIYASYREAKNARAIDSVARMALKDEGIYTEAQLSVLRAYAPTTEVPVIDFYLIAGQSNAAGSTNFQSDFANRDPAFQNGYSHVYYSGFSMSGSGISNKMVHSCVPVKIGYGNSLTNFGPELGLADALSSHYNAQSGKYAAIIKYAYSGINLYDTLAAPCDAEGNWCPPSWLAEHGVVDSVRSGQQYRAFVHYIAECVSDYEAMGYEVNIVAAYWMQGEQDVEKNGKTGEYGDLLTCFIGDLRNDVTCLMGDEKYLKLPFMIGELSAYLSEPSNDPVHFGNTAGLIAAQHEVAAALDRVWVLEQSNIPSFDIEPGVNSDNRDRYHWIAENMLWIGQQLGYTVLEEILDENIQFSDEEIVAKVYRSDELLGSYNSLVGAISSAPEGAVIVLQKDVTLYSTLVIGNTNAITIDGHGYTLNIVVPVKVNTGSNDDNLNCGALRLYATDLTVRDLNVTLNANIKKSVKGVYTLFNAEVVWEGCTFTQGERLTSDFANVTENIACTFDWSEILSEA